MSHKLSKRLTSLGLLFMLCLGTAVAAQDMNQAAVVISLGNGEFASRCVEFEEEEITGYELLSRSGLAFESNVIGMGASVCRIQDVGCPSTNCFCSCKGDSCFYWSYWHQENGAWRYSQIGATVRPVKDGDIEGWVWGIGTPNEAPQPPDISLEAVCDTGDTQAELNGEPSEIDAVDPIAGAQPGIDESRTPVSDFGETAVVKDAADQRGDQAQAVDWFVCGAAGFVVAIVALLAVRSTRGKTAQ